MTFELAVRLTEVMLGLALLQQAAEHVRAEPWPHVARLVLAVLLLSGWVSGPAIWGLLGAQLWLLHCYQGPYNGGSDKMTLLILSILSLVHLAPDRFWQEMAFSYLALQLVLSYFVSGWVKLRNPAWRSGSALVDVFALSAYPVSTAARRWADRPNVLWLASWSVIVLEVAFPLSLFHPIGLVCALGAMAVFHLGNAISFGLHRFFWIWLCAYPSLIWFQGRLLAVSG